MKLKAAINKIVINAYFHAPLASEAKRKLKCNLDKIFPFSYIKTILIFAILIVFTFSILSAESVKTVSKDAPGTSGLSPYAPLLLGISVIITTLAVVAILLKLNEPELAKALKTLKIEEKTVKIPYILRIHVASQFNDMKMDNDLKIKAVQMIAATCISYKGHGIIDLQDLVHLANNKDKFQDLVKKQAEAIEEKY